MTTSAAARSPLLAPAATRGRHAFVAFAAFTLVYLLFVILFGAWVRISGSGAGCGEHWPSCHGQLVPESLAADTRIELTHRVTSALSGLLAIALPVWAWRLFPRGHGVRRASLALLVLIIIEGGIGAGLVLGRLVGENASALRAFVVALHLVNTLLLMACAGLTTALAWRSAQTPWGTAWRRASALKWLGAAWLLGLLVVSALGAVTALGDTLYVNPAGVPIAAPPGPDHFLVRLRVVHPLLACGVSLVGGGLFWRLAATTTLRRPAIAAGALLALQLVVGAFSIVLGAPGWLQIVHLLMAQLLWLVSIVVGRYGLEAGVAARGG